MNYKIFFHFQLQIILKLTKKLTRNSIKFILKKKLTIDKECINQYCMNYKYAKRTNRMYCIK